jgi:hypothetical protein
MLDDVLEHGRIELVCDFLPATFADDEPGIPQHREMPRNRRPTRVEPVGYLTRRHGTLAQERQDLTTRVVGQGAKGS